MYIFPKKSLRTTKTFLQLGSFFLLSFFALSCKKGDTGPAGATGSANVIYSDWFKPSSYVKDTVFNVYGFSYTKLATDISQEVVDSGLVIVYGKLYGYNPPLWIMGQVGQLPITLSYKFSAAGITYNDTWTATETAGNLKIRFVNDQNYYNSISNNHQFRYIVIPGGKKSTVTSVIPGVRSGSGKQLEAANVKEVIANYAQMSYAEVCERLGVPQ